jgi:hypothetical protein
MSFIDKIFGKDRSKKDGNKGEREMVIGTPTNVVRGLHVSKNHLTGDLEGLPKPWQALLQTMITQDEQNENPDAGWWHIFSHTMCVSLAVSFSSTHSLAFVMCMSCVRYNNICLLATFDESYEKMTISFKSHNTFVVVFILSSSYSSRLQHIRR